MSAGKARNPRPSGAAAERPKRKPRAKKASVTAPGALDRLVVIDRLEVGPVRIEPRKVTTPYVVVRGRKREATELIYRYEEPVFDKTAASINLASMIGAQVALNYGPFCRQIVFHGAFDEADRRFLTNFAENTAREIYVHKLLRHNVYVTASARDLPVERRPRHSQAELVFAEPERAGEEKRNGSVNGEYAWSSDPSRYAVLSSGGKDSLLSYGILGELGLRPHPIFVNESGRHWYTALNAYRHFRATIPDTARVWTNSDRVFAWMLRHLPFIRKDFARIRSDEYPIRLWTVAVFIFGALPLLRKRRIGRLLIGNEFDTTARGSHEGVPHYDALFDQSRLFDNELSRYYRRKKWLIAQFSILRPLSELLVEKILVERYPDLQQQQVSCHAAHLEGDRVRPCGKCEKCRRIVGMLLALGADPTRCGYTRRQIDDCLKAVIREGVNQESVAVGQLAHMLQQKGLLPASKQARFRPRPHPETLAPRFDPLRSPVEAIPRELRERVYRIFLEHADPAVSRNGRVWVAFDPLGKSALAKPYPFEYAAASAASQRALAPRAAAEGATDYLLGELNWQQAEARFGEVDVALLPVGALEQHGPHLPLDTDAYDADLLCRKVAAACSEPRPLVLPLIPYGVSYHHAEFSGTISVSPETLSRVVYEIGMSIAHWGVTKLVIVNGHGGNGPALHLAAQMINRDAHIFTCVDSGETSDAEVDDLVETHNDAHAGEIETSTSLAVRPHLVRMSRAPKKVPRFTVRYLDFTTKGSVGWYSYTKRISKTGVLGDATRATAEKGREIWELMTRRLVELVEDLKGLALDEIYEKRY